MNSREQGRYCGSCCKVVVDFTQMSNAAIADYLVSHKEQKTCGRFRTTQVLDLPAKKFRFSFSIQRFAAAVLLAFGAFLFTGCSNSKPTHGPEVMGDVGYVPDTTVKHQQADTTVKHTMGKPQVIEVIPDDQIMGEICILPEETNEQ